jgi:hypothetical protein
MVQAILDGKKTMTRRVVKHQDCVEFDKEGAIYVHHHKCPSYCEYGCNGVGFGASRYGIPGDHLWLRETWIQLPNNTVLYRATDEDRQEAWTMYGKPKWRPSIFMFRWMSRITLEITNVRVERLQDINEKDAKAEGCQQSATHSCREKFAELWDSINKKRGFGWDTNPFCWVVSFRRIK